MAGHSHWANIAHKKALIDSQARQAVEQARQRDHGRGQGRRRRSECRTCACVTRSSTPKPATCRRTRSTGPSRKGTGELEGVNFEEILYEGYGPDGVAILVRHPHRQSQSHGRRSPQDLRNRRRQARRDRLRRLDVRPQGSALDSGRPDRGRSADGPRARGRRRRRPPRGRQLRGHLRSRTSIHTRVRRDRRGRPQDGSPPDHAHSQRTRSISTPRPRPTCSS